MNGKITTKYEINLKTLAKNARAGDKSFMYYNNSKPKINTIIRKNKLPDFIIEYLWQSKIYKKEIVRNQKHLPPSVREDIVYMCVRAYSNSPWTSILRNFLKSHNPTDAELMMLVSGGGDNEHAHDSIVLECWDQRPNDCNRLKLAKLLYPVIIRNSDKEGFHKQIVNIVSKVIEDYPELEKELFDNILSINNDIVIGSILIPVFKITKLNDFSVDYLLSHTSKAMFKTIIKNAMHRENISDNMMAKLYLAID